VSGCFFLNMVYLHVFGVPIFSGISESSVLFISVMSCITVYSVQDVLCENRFLLMQLLSLYD